MRWWGSTLSTARDISLIGRGGRRHLPKPQILVTMPKGRKKKHAAPRYVSNADELANRSGAFAKDQKDRTARRKAAGCDDEELNDMMGKSSMLDLASGGGGGGDDSDDEQFEKRQKKPKGIAAIIGLETESLNGKKKKNTLSKQQVANGGFVKAQLTRRQKEELDAQSNARKYLALTKAGKTDESKKDLARLKAMRAHRDAKKQKRLEEEAVQQVKDAEEARLAKRAAEEANAQESSDDEDIPTKIEIKKMKPTMLKELLKRRGESSQGSKKDLLKRALKSCGYA